MLAFQLAFRLAWLRNGRARALLGEDGIVEPFAAEVGDVLYERHD